MTKVTRARALALAGAAASAALLQCSGSGAIRIGSKNFTESFVIAEIYAQALERAGIAVQRLFNLGSTQIALAAMARGSIDLYPEYTGTALIDVLHHAPIRDPRALYETVKREFARRFDLVWLDASPMDDSQGMAMTASESASLHIQTLSQLAVAAPRLRLATIGEFLSRPDGLPGLQKFYGGFRFRDVRTYDIALKYRALLAGQADVATAFTTDGAIVTDRLVVLRDDKHFWPPYNVAPVVRRGTLDRHPRIADVLNRVSPRITTDAARAMNASVESRHQDPTDVASHFLGG